MLKKPEKHTSYFNLQDALAEPGCPVCRLAMRRTDRFFASLLSEKVTDPDFRQRFNENGGLCNHHSHRLLACDDQLPTGLIYRSLLRERIARHRDPAKKKPARPDPAAACPACAAAAETELGNLEIIRDFAGDPEFREKFLRSNGLCFPHYERLSVLVRPLPDWLAEFQLRTFDTRLEVLDRFLDSKNFSLGDKRPVLKKTEEAVWRDTVGMLAGYPGMRPA